MRRIATILAILCAGVLGTAGLAAAQHEPPPHGGSLPEHGAPVGEHGAPTEGTPAGAHGGGHDEHALKSINWADFSNSEQKPYAIMLFNFAILVGLYYALGKKPITEALKLRRTVVAKEIEEAQRMKREAEARAKQYQAKLATLSEELEATKQALVEAGKGERDRIIKEAQEKAERMVRDATFLLEQEVKQMRQDLVRETVEVAMTAAEELLKKRMTPADHERLADEYLSELIAKSPRSLAPPPQPQPPPPLAQGGIT